MLLLLWQTQNTLSQLEFTVLTIKGIEVINNSLLNKSWKAFVDFTDPLARDNRRPAEGTVVSLGKLVPVQLKLMYTQSVFASQLNTTSTELNHRTSSKQNSKNRLCNKELHICRVTAPYRLCWKQSKSSHMKTAWTLFPLGHPEKLMASYTRVRLRA